MMRWVTYGALAAATALPICASAQDCQPQTLKSADGPGVMVRRDCTRYEGTFRGGKLHGQGKVSSKDGASTEGVFIDGNLWGDGKITYPDGRVAEGQFIQGYLSGKGTMSWPDGRRHEGVFYNGSPAGFGKYRDARGLVSQGMFDSSGKLMGLGVRTQPDGGKIIGEFRDDKLVGEALLIRPNGTQEKQTYSMDGRLVSTPSPASSSAASPAAAQSPAAQQPSPAPAKPPQQSGSSPSGQVLDEVNRAIRDLRGIIRR